MAEPVILKVTELLPEIVIVRLTLAVPEPVMEGVIEVEAVAPKAIWGRRANSNTAPQKASRALGPVTRFGCTRDVTPRGLGASCWSHTRAHTQRHACRITTTGTDASVCK